MEWLKDKLASKKIVTGTWLTIGSNIIAEVAGLKGFDWLLIDNEHGYGGDGAVIHQVQAISATSAQPVVRVAKNDIALIKRALDAGANGIMVPLVNTAQQAQEAVSYMRYPPDGIRGLSRSNRASEYGDKSTEYFPCVNEKLLKIMQIETLEAVNNVDSIAKVDGADVLFVGPSDLGLNLGISSDLDQPEFAEKLKKVTSACKKHGKYAGILVKNKEQLQWAASHGFSLIALGTDLGVLSKGLKQIAGTFDEIA